MNLKEQQYVCTLARCQSLSRAAEELFISPSALSVYISNLEKYLGVRLFERTGRGKAFVLTSIGEEYVVRAEKMLELKAEFEGLVENELHRSHPADLQISASSRSRRKEFEGTRQNSLGQHLGRHGGGHFQLYFRTFVPLIEINLFLSVFI